jgi:hypothetical protein
MRYALTITVLLAGTTLAGCGDYNKKEYNEANAAYGEQGNYDAAAAGGNYGATASSDWPEGTRIIEENHVYYRVEPSGTRVRLEPGDSTIVVENGIRFRVDPGGTRVRINDEGAAMSVGPGGVEANVPVGGNTTVTVNQQ